MQKQNRNPTNIFACLLLSCVALAAACADRVTDKKSDGPVSDKVVTEVREAEGFSRISIAGAVESKIDVGKKFAVSVEGKASEVQFVETRVIDETLYVGFKKGYLSSDGVGRLVINISLPTLEQFGAFGATKNSINGLTAESLELELKGTSKTEISGKVDQLEASLTGSSVLESRKLAVEEGEFEMLGSAKAVVNAKKLIRVVGAGASKLEYLGSPEIEKVLSSAAEVKKVE